MWLNIYLNPPPGHAGLETCSIDPQINWVVCHIKFQTKPSSLSPNANWVVSFLHLHTPHNKCGNTFTGLGLIATAFHTPHWHWSQINQLPTKAWRLTFDQNKCQVPLFPINTNPLLVFLHLSWWRPLVWGWKLVELNFFASFSADDQRKTYVSNVSKKNTKRYIT